MPKVPSQILIPGNRAVEDAQRASFALGNSRWYNGDMIENLKDKVLEGKWQYHHYQDNHYVFENIYNGTTIALRLRQVQNILEGKDTISRIQCRKIWKEGKSKTTWNDNGVIRSYSKQIHKYRKPRRSGI